MSDSSTSTDLASSLRALLTGLAPGDRLPSSRELTRRYRVGPGTVSRAIATLAAEGAVVTRPGSGTFVALRRERPADGVPDTSWQSVALSGRDFDPGVAVEPPRPLPEGMIAMAGGYPHETLQPTRALGAALARAARRPDAWHRAPTAGLAPLRAIFARQAGGAVTAEDVLVTGGAQGALSMLFRAIAAPGCAVLMESPTYPGALAAARAAGLRPVPVPMDGDGIRPGLLADAFAMTGARVLYCQPTFHNPTGTVLAPERRGQVAEVARAAGAFLIEDDFARHLGHGGPLPPPLVADDRDGTVIHLTSLTKPAAPSLRIGAVIARGPVLRRLAGMRFVDDFFTARPLQEAAIELLSTPAWDRHLRALGAALRERRTLLVGALATRVPGWRLTRSPAGGLHLWVELPPGADDAAFAAAAREHGVAVDAGRRFFPAEPSGAYLRLSFAAAADTADLAEGAHRLAAVARGEVRVRAETAHP
ncbi:aminotransferase-like domain-containing protein [Nonomuraea glycinis]|uniref:aminotransferase-like domain-containing protein n=1 Tax=Nonomuraea glycinis TaxID=2047744 RepID=UPI002E0FAF76|nr:PLP-dependent aminotransferase family protein [Nonomuraea glycinis]